MPPPTLRCGENPGQEKAPELGVGQFHTLCHCPLPPSTMNARKPRVCGECLMGGPQITHGGAAAAAQSSGRWRGRVAALASCTTNARI